MNCDTIRPLIGHDSAETAYVIEDYPYGFRMRCRRRCWVEYHPKKGWRFWTQTSNPKIAGEPWNRPKASTYSGVAGAMYLDGEGHVHFHGLGFGADADDVRQFANRFPGSNLTGARLLAHAQLRYYQATIAGKVRWTINGEPMPVTEEDIERARAKVAKWLSVAELLMSLHLVRDHGWRDTFGLWYDDMLAAHKLEHESSRAAAAAVVQVTRDACNSSRDRL